MMRSTRSSRRRDCSNKNNSYENLEERRLLAVTAMFSGGDLMVSLTESMDEAIITSDAGDVRVNGDLVDTDLKMDGIQAATVDDITSLTVEGSKGLDDLSVRLNGFFDTGALNSISLANINQVLFNGIYATCTFDAVFVGDGGSISGPGQLAVSGDTQIQSNDVFNVTLDNPSNDFVGAVSVATDGDVSLRDANAIVLRNIAAQDLTVDAPGMISDSAGSTITVPGVSEFTASSVNLGNNGSPVDLFVVISNTVGNFSLNEASTFIWGDNSTVGSANINAVGLVTTGPFSNINVIGDAVLNAGSLRLGIGGSNTFNTGRINVNTTDNAFVWENSAVELFGNNSVADLDIIATGNITNSENAVITVEGISSFQSVTSVTIGNAAGDTFNTGFLEFFSSVVNVSEDSSTAISGLANFAGDLTINSNGTITDTDEAFILIQGNGTFISIVDDVMENAGVNLGDSIDDFFIAGSVSFDVTDGDFVLRENNGTIIASQDGFVNTADAINIFSSGDIVNGNSSILRVANTATLAGENITIGQALNDNVQIGSVNLNTGGNATVAEDDGVVLTGNSFVGGDLVINGLGGSVGDSNSSILNVVGQASFFADTNIILGDMDTPIDDGPGDVFDVGTVRFFAGGDVDITQNGDIVLAGNTTHQTGGQASLTATGNLDDVGRINNEAGADVSVAGNLFLTGFGNITLGTDAADVINFGDLNFNTLGTVRITAIFDDVEDEFFIFGGVGNPNAANELFLTTNVDVLDGVNAFIDITSFVSISARNITLGDTVTDCLMLPEDMANWDFVATGQQGVSVTPDAVCP